jgi:hypothetical protein
MRRAFLLAACLCLLPATAASAADSAPSQPLFITINGQGAVAKSLEQYTPDTPIAVQVSTRRATDVDAVTLIAMGPSGSPIRAQLTRSAGGTFTGELNLNEAGSWTLTVSERTGTFTTETSPLGLDVSAQTVDMSAPLALGGGAVLFLLLGSVGFIVLRRRAAIPAHARAA